MQTYQQQTTQNNQPANFEYYGAFHQQNSNGVPQFTQNGGQQVYGQPMNSNNNKQKRGRKNNNNNKANRQANQQVNQQKQQQVFDQQNGPAFHAKASGKQTKNQKNNNCSKFAPAFVSNNQSNNLAANNFGNQNNYQPAFAPQGNQAVFQNTKFQKTINTTRVQNVQQQNSTAFATTQPAFYTAHQNINSQQLQQNGGWMNDATTMFGGEQQQQMMMAKQPKNNNKQARNRNNKQKQQQQGFPATQNANTQPHLFGFGSQHHQINNDQQRNSGFLHVSNAFAPCPTLQHATASNPTSFENNNNFGGFNTQRSAPTFHNGYQPGFQHGPLSFTPDTFGQRGQQQCWSGVNANASTETQYQDQEMSSNSDFLAQVGQKPKKQKQKQQKPQAFFSQIEEKQKKEQEFKPALEKEQPVRGNETSNLPLPKRQPNALYPDLVIFDNFEHARACTKNKECGATTLLAGNRMDGFLKENEGFGQALCQSYALNAVYRDDLDLVGNGLTQQEKEELMQGIPRRADCF